MTRRRQNFPKPARDQSADAKGRHDALAQRVAMLEHLCADLKESLDQRIAAIQAQLDHLAAKFSGR